MTLSPSPSFNDLIGLEYDWSSSPSDGNGKTNCFAMCMEVRQRLGLGDFRQMFEHLYRQPQEKRIGVKQILRLLKQYGQCIKDPRLGAIFCLPSSTSGIAMAVIVDSENCLLLNPGGRVIRMPFATISKGNYYWAE